MQKLRHLQTPYSMLSLFLVNKELRTVSEKLVNYVNFESWKYCEKCHLVEPNNMLPNYGNQKQTQIAFAEKEDTLFQWCEYFIYLFLSIFS